MDGKSEAPQHQHEVELGTGATPPLGTFLLGYHIDTLYPATIDMTMVVIIKAMKIIRLKFVAIAMNMDTMKRLQNRRNPVLNPGSALKLTRRLNYGISRRSSHPVL